MSSSSSLSIAVLAGGYSGESIISFQSAATVMEHIDRDLFSPVLVKIETPKSWWVDISGNKKSEIDQSDFSWIDNSGVVHKFDLVFIMVHGTPGEDGVLQRYFEGLNIPFTTGSSESVSGTFNKFLTTSKLRDAGFSVGDAVILTSETSTSTESLIKISSKIGLPCFVKPNQGGSSLGITRVEELSQLPLAIESAFATKCNLVIVESFLDGREFSMGIVPDINGDSIAMPITEIVSDNIFFDYQAKYEGASKEITPAKISKELTLIMKETGLKAYDLLGCRGMIRIDFILIDHEIPAILEINAVPGFSQMSILPQQLEQACISIREQLTNLINASL